MQRLRKIFKTILAVLHTGIVIAVSSWAFAQMNTNQGGGMMNGGWGWGMNAGWFFVIIIAILAIVVIAYVMKRR